MFISIRNIILDLGFQLFPDILCILKITSMYHRDNINKLVKMSSISPQTVMAVMMLLSVSSAFSLTNIDETKGGYGTGEIGFGRTLGDQLLLTQVAVAPSPPAHSSSQNYTFEEYHLFSNMIITPKYALIGNAYTMDLKKVDFETRKFETYSYEIPISQYYADIVVADLKNGDIAAGLRQSLLILDNETLEVKQVLVGDNQYQYVAHIYTYLDQNNQRGYFVGRYGHPTFYQLTKDSEGIYTEKPAFVSQNNQNDFQFFQPSLPNSSMGVSTGYCQITYWRNFNSILDKSRDLKYLMDGRQYAAVSYGETFFVLRSNAGAFEFYTIDNKYEVTLTSSIFINRNQQRKAMLTNDDANLFVALSNLEQQNVAKYSISKGELTFVTDEDGSANSQIDFHLFDAAQNMFATVALRNKQHFLQLRSIDTLRLLSETPLRFEFPILEYKLVGGIEWGPTFGLAVRTSPYYSDLEIDSKLYLFRVDDGKIVSLNITAVGVSFATLKACYKYVVSYKLRYSKLKIFHFSNLTLASQIEIPYDSDNQISIQKNIILLKYLSEIFVFNLEDSFESKGLFFIIPFNIYYIRIIFPKRGIVYHAAYKEFYNLTITKSIYNISSPAVSSIVPIMEPVYLCNSPLYFIPPQQSAQKCNSVFFMEFSGLWIMIQHWFSRYDECTKKIQRFPVDIEMQFRSFGTLFISSDKKYLIVLAKEEINGKHILEIRRIEALTDVIFHETFHVEYDRFGIDGYNVDVIDDKVIVLHTPSTISVIYPDFTDKDAPSNEQLKIISRKNLAQE